MGINRGEQAEILGRKQETVTVNGGADIITLRPLSWNDQAELQEKEFSTEAQGSMWVTWRAAVRGGYQGTQEEFGDLIEGDEILECAEAMARLSPKTVAAGEAMMAAQAAAVTGSGVSGA